MGSNPWNNSNGRPSRFRTQRAIAAAKRREKQKRHEGLRPVCEIVPDDHPIGVGEIDVYVNGTKVARGLRQLDGSIAWPDVWIHATEELIVDYPYLAAPAAEDHP